MGILLSNKNRALCIDLIHNMSMNYNHPMQVTFHAIDIFDNIISRSDIPITNLTEFLTYSSVTAYRLAAKMFGKFPSLSGMTFAVNINMKKLELFELFVLNMLHWNVHSCYAFASMDLKIPIHMKSYYEKLMMSSYKLFQKRKYSAECIMQAILNILQFGNLCILKNGDENDDENEQIECEIELRQDQECAEEVAFRTY